MAMSAIAAKYTAAVCLAVSEDLVELMTGSSPRAWRGLGILSLGHFQTLSNDRSGKFAYDLTRQLCWYRQLPSYPETMIG